MAPQKPPNQDWLDVNAILSSWRQNLNQQAATGPASKDIAAQILANSRVNWQQQAPEPSKKRKALGVVNRVFDVLSRGNYASAETFRQLTMPAEPGQSVLDQTSDVFGGALAGLAGKKKTTYAKVFKEKEAREGAVRKDGFSNFKRGLTGLVFDVGLDPLTYLGVGLLGKGGKATGLVPPVKPPQPGGHTFSTMTQAPPSSVINPATGLVNVNAAGKIPLPSVPRQLAYPSGRVPLGAGRRAAIEPNPSWSGVATIAPPAARRSDDEIVNDLWKIINSGTLPHLESGRLSNKIIQFENLRRSDYPDDIQSLLGVAKAVGAKLPENTFTGRAAGTAIDVPKINPRAGIAQNALTAGRIPKGSFPKVTIPPTAAAKAEGTNKEIRKLIETVRPAAGNPAKPVGFGKMNKTQLVAELTKLRESAAARASVVPAEDIVRNADSVDDLNLNPRQIREDELADDLRSRATKAADDYVKNVLSRPNQFAQGGKTFARYSPVKQANMWNKLQAEAVGHLTGKVVSGIASRGRTASSAVPAATGSTISSTAPKIVSVKNNQEWLDLINQGDPGVHQFIINSTKVGNRSTRLAVPTNLMSRFNPSMFTEVKKASDIIDGKYLKGELGLGNYLQHEFKIWPLSVAHKIDAWKNGSATKASLVADLNQSAMQNIRRNLTTTEINTILGMAKNKFHWDPVAKAPIKASGKKKAASGVPAARAVTEADLSPPMVTIQVGGSGASGVSRGFTSAQAASKSAKMTKARMGTTYSMMKIAEEALEKAGYSATYWDGSHLKLTEVIDELGGPMKVKDEHMNQVLNAFKTGDFDKIESPEVLQVFEKLRAADALKNAPIINMVASKAAQQGQVAQQVMSQPGFEAFKTKILNQNNQILRNTGISPASATAANSLITRVLSSGQSPATMAIQANGRALSSYIAANGTISWGPHIANQTRAISRASGAAPPSGAQDTENWFLSRVATWYGNKDLRPDVLIATQTAKASANARAAFWNQVAKDFTPEQIDEAFKAAQGGLQASTPEISQLTNNFVKSLENLFDSTELTREAVRGNTAAYRSGMIIGDINHQLKITGSNNRFTMGKKVADPRNPGQTVDYSNGTDWLKSWETMKVSDPIEFMHKTQMAVEQVMHKYSFLDEFGARWGSKVKSSDFAATVSHPRLKGLYFPREIAPQFEKAMRTWDQVYNPRSEMVKTFDRALSAWKSGVTIYAPSHHIRNMIGDVYLAWMGGVNNPRVYDIARKTLMSQRNRYRDIDSVDTLTGRNALGQALTRPGERALITGSGTPLTHEQVYIAAHNHGLLQSAHAVEDIIAEPFLKRKPLGGRVSGPLRSFSESREHFVRLAHFIDQIKKNKSSDLNEVFRTASMETRKWHPDGMDLTEFERNYMRRIMPFYSWTRKAIPLVVESAVTKPGKVIAYPKANYALQEMMGMEVGGPADPFPADQLFPEWIKEKGIGPAFQIGMGGIPGMIAGMGRAGTDLAGNDSGYTIVNPSNPTIDLLAQLGGQGKPMDLFSGIGSMLNPAIRIPGELATDHTTIGTPISGDYAKYFTEQVPIVAAGSRISGYDFGGQSEKGKKEGMNQEAFINWLTAMGIKGTGPYAR